MRQAVRSTVISPLFTELWNRTRHSIMKSHSISRNAAMARRNWRRIVYFLNEGPTVTDNERKIFDGFLSTFIGSYFAINLLKWKESPETFQPAKLKPALFVALQRQFSGIVVPNGPIHDWTLFLTLGKLSKDINQNAQLVLCKVPFNEKLSIELSEGKLFLAGKKELKNHVHMELPLSFIDYVFAIRSGELGRGLQLSYRDRIENLKSIIQKQLGSSEADELLIMQRSNDGRISTISVSVSNNKMVVSND